MTGAISGNPLISDPYASYTPLSASTTPTDVTTVVIEGEAKRSKAEVPSSPVPRIVGMPTDPYAATFVTIRPPSVVDEAGSVRHDTALGAPPSISRVASHPDRAASASIAVSLYSNALIKRLARPTAELSELMTSRLDTFNLEALGRPNPPVCSEETERKLHNLQKEIAANMPVPLSTRVCGCFSKCCVKDEETRRNCCLNLLCQFRASFISLSCCFTVTSSIIQSLSPYMWKAPDSIEWPPVSNFLDPLLLNAGVAAVANASTQDHAINSSSILAKANAEREHLFHGLKRQYTEMASTLLDNYTSASLDHIDVVDKIGKDQIDELTNEIDSIIKTRHKHDQVVVTVQLAANIENNFPYIRKTLLEKFGPVDVNVLEHLVDAVTIILNSNDINNGKPMKRLMGSCHLLRTYTSTRDEQARKIAIDAKGIKESSKFADKVKGLAKGHKATNRAVTELRKDLDHETATREDGVAGLKEALEESERRHIKAIKDLRDTLDLQTKLLGTIPAALSTITEEMATTRTTLNNELEPVREGLMDQAKALATVKKDAALAHELITATESTVQTLRDADNKIRDEIRHQTARLYATNADVTRSHRKLRALKDAVVTLDETVTALEERPAVVHATASPTASHNLPSPAPAAPPIDLSSPPHRTVPSHSAVPSPATLFRLPFAAPAHARRSDRPHHD